MRYIDVAQDSDLPGRHGGHNRVDYRFTVEMAKPVCQLSRKLAATSFVRYFIDRDNQLRRLQIP